MVIIGMNEYISKEYIRNVVLKHWGDSVGAECYAYARVLDDIGDAPVADVSEIKHGRWQWEANGEIRCSHCNSLIGVAFSGYPFELTKQENIYCYNCGARMDA